MVQLLLGRPDEALKLSDEALRRARQLKHPLTHNMTVTTAIQLRYERREPEAVQKLAEEAIALSEEHGFLPEQTSIARSFRGWAISRFSQVDQVITELERSVALAPGQFRRQILGMLAQHYMRVGRADQALAVLDEDLARSGRSGEYFYEPEIHRLQGEAIMVRDPSATSEAEKSFRKAIDVARGQSAKWFEPHTSVSLARLLDRGSSRRSARNAGRNLQLVHRGLRHRGPEGRHDAAR
jgi:tetratricopeptide (TPR) repeat protein